MNYYASCTECSLERTTADVEAILGRRSDHRDEHTGRYVLELERL